MHILLIAKGCKAKYTREISKQKRIKENNNNNNNNAKIMKTHNMKTIIVGLSSGRGF
jgi:hypothetical protein